MLGLLLCLPLTISLPLYSGSGQRESLKKSEKPLVYGNSFENCRIKTAYEYTIWAMYCNSFIKRKKKKSKLRQLIKL